MFGARVKLAPCAQERMDEALQTGAEINHNLERLTFAVSALHGTVLVLALVACAYFIVRDRNA